MDNYLVTLEQHGEADMEDTRFTIRGRLYGTKQAQPAKMGLTAAELGEYLPVLGIPFSKQHAVFRELAQTKHCLVYSETLHRNGSGAWVVAKRWIDIFNL